jgi:hypothetical protein
MAVEQAGDTDTDVEAVQEQRGADRAPPDNPGGEAAHSRADSRAGAASATDAGQQTSEKAQDNQSEAAQPPETSAEQDPTADEDGSDSATTADATSDVVESGEDQYAGNRRPPRDSPGSEPEDVPSRADSRAGAAAASDSQPPDDTVHVADDHEPRLDLEAPTETTEGTPGSSEDTPDNPETPTKHLGSPTGSAELDEDEPNGMDTAEARSLGDRLTVDGRPLREYLDPAGAAAWSNASVEQNPEPAGDRVVNEETDRRSRFDRVRKKGYESSDEVIEHVDKGANSLKDILTRHPPTGHAEARTGPTAAAGTHDGISAGDAGTAVLMTGLLVGEGIRQLHGRLPRKKET